MIVQIIREEESSDLQQVTITDILLDVNNVVDVNCYSIALNKMKKGGGA